MKIMRHWSELCSYKSYHIERLWPQTDDYNATGYFRFNWMFIRVVTLCCNQFYVQVGFWIGILNLLPSLMWSTMDWDGFRGFLIRISHFWIRNQRFEKWIFWFITRKFNFDDLGEFELGWELRKIEKFWYFSGFRVMKIRVREDQGEKKLFPWTVYLPSDLILKDARFHFLGISYEIYLKSTIPCEYENLWRNLILKFLIEFDSI